MGEFGSRSVPSVNHPTISAGLRIGCSFNTMQRKVAHSPYGEKADSSRFDRVTATPKGSAARLERLNPFMPAPAASAASPGGTVLRQNRIEKLAFAAWSAIPEPIWPE